MAGASALQELVDNMQNGPLASTPLVTSAAAPDAQGSAVQAASSNAPPSLPASNVQPTTGQVAQADASGASSQPQASTPPQQTPAPSQDPSLDIYQQYGQQPPAPSASPSTQPSAPDPNDVYQQYSQQPPPSQSKKSDVPWYKPQTSDMAYRFAEGLQNPVVGTGQALANIDSAVGITPPEYAEQINKEVTQRDKDYDTQHPVNGPDWANLAGNIVSPANALLPLEGISRIGQGVSAAARAGKAALTGATQMLINPTDTGDGVTYAGGKAKQAAEGALTAGALSGGGSAISSLLKPDVSTDAQKLMDEGIPTTAGQTAGGWMKGLEDKASSWPVIGGLIKNQQANAIEGLNKAAVNRGLSYIGDQIPDSVSAGHEAIEYAQGKFNDAYDKVLPNINGDLTAKTTNNFGQSLLGGGAQQPAAQDFTTKVGDLLNNDYYDMHPDMQAKLQQILKKEIIDRVNPDGTFNGDQAKTVESRLTQKIGQYGGSSDSDSRMLGNALDDIKSAFRDQMTGNSPEAAAQLQGINKGYANFKIAQRASSSVAAPNGVFTPAQLLNSVKASDRSVDNGNFAKGQALMQDLASAAKNVLPNKVPDSGTAGRELAAGATGAVLGGGGALLSHPIAGTALGAMAGLYTQPGQTAARYLMTARPPGASALSTLAKKASDLSRLHPYALIQN